MSTGESWASSPATRATMQANRGRDTGPERALRSALHAMGLRFRVATRPIKGVRRTADIVFGPARVAVYVDGCFWHGCPEHYTAPKSNADFWRNKVDGNRARDRNTDELMAEAGWTVVRVWEHEDPLVAAQRVAAVVAEKRHAVTRRPR
jgi:DNA mismatch endonuclease (patch repair protein)